MRALGRGGDHGHHSGWQRWSVVLLPVGHGGVVPAGRPLQLVLSTPRLPLTTVSPGKSGNRAPRAMTCGALARSRTSLSLGTLAGGFSLDAMIGRQAAKFQGNIGIYPAIAAARLMVMADSGLIESAGDLRMWGYSEVRLNS